MDKKLTSKKKKKEKLTVERGTVQDGIGEFYSSDA